MLDRPAVRDWVSGASASGLDWLSSDVRTLWGSQYFPFVNLICESPDTAVNFVTQVRRGWAKREVWVVRVLGSARGAQCRATCTASAQRYALYFQLLTHDCFHETKLHTAYLGSPISSCLDRSGPPAWTAMGRRLKGGLYSIPVLLWRHCPTVSAVILQEPWWTLWSHLGIFELSLEVNLGTQKALC